MRIFSLSLLLLLTLAACSSTPATPPATRPAAPGILRLAVAPTIIQNLADENKTLPLTQWPIYYNTNLPIVSTPDELRQYVKAHPKFSAPDLGFYKVMIMKIQGRPTYVFYHQDSKTLVLVPVK